MTVLQSPRWRRRLAWGGGAMAFAAVFVIVGIRNPNTVDDDQQAAPVAVDAQVYKEPKHVTLSRVERAKVLATAANFVTHAVARRGVAQAYDLTHPSMRGDMTRAEWQSGTIPVVPFPVEQARWKLEYAYDDGIGLQVLLFPTAKSGLKPEVFNMELAAVGKNFLVTSWAPTGMAGGGTPSAASSAGVGGTRDLGAAMDGPTRLDQRWLFAPILLFALVPLFLIGFFVRGWLRGRRAAAEYAAASPARQLPPLRR